MKNPRSSSRSSSSQSLPWYREPWPWLLAAGPLIVVVASMATTVIAVKSDDGMVANDYYKQGLLVNQRLPKEGVTTPHVAATVSLGAGGEVRIRPEAGDPQGDFLRVALYHPASGVRETLTLARRDDGAFAGTLKDARSGRWIATVESAGWALPVAMVDRGGEARVATSSSIR